MFKGNLKRWLSLYLISHYGCLCLCACVCVCVYDVVHME